MMDTKQSLECLGGQITLAQWLMTNMIDELSPRVRFFLQSTLDKAYAQIGTELECPGEDVALVIQEIMEERKIDI
jgi:hypothetical protein